MGQFSESSESTTTASGIFYLDGSLEDNELTDSLGNHSALEIREAWRRHGESTSVNKSLRSWLRTNFFDEVHCPMYEGKPIYFPFSSAGKTFVVFVNVHKFKQDALKTIVADHLNPTLTRIDGHISDLLDETSQGEKSAESDDQLHCFQSMRKELADFIDLVILCSDKGPPPTDSKCPEREVDRDIELDLNDGIMICSAPFWCLVEPQWEDPKVWWKQLAIQRGIRNNDYDWSSLAMCYFPTRVDKKCHADPSLGVAHGCFWKYHPSIAWKWELRLQDEIGTDFRVEEGEYRGDGGHEVHRADYLRDNPKEAFATVEKEILRRLKDADSIKVMTLLESGLWSALPEDCWNLETKIIKKQKAEFRLVAPDEKKARKELLKAKPDLKKTRNDLLNKYESKRLFADEPDEEVTA